MILGGSKTFRALLDSLNLKHNDRLFLLGDYVDRGNGSRGVLDIILQLKDSRHGEAPIDFEFEPVVPPISKVANVVPPVTCLFLTVVKNGGSIRTPIVGQLPTPVDNLTAVSI